METVIFYQIFKLKVFKDIFDLISQRGCLMLWIGAVKVDVFPRQVLVDIRFQLTIREVNEQIIIEAEPINSSFPVEKMAL